jgi:hypothetical protein
MGRHHPGTTSIWDEFQENRDKRGFAREIVKADDSSLAVKMMQQGLGALRGAIGTPEQVTELVRRYQAVGVDQIIFVLQAGPNKHEHIVESLELFAEEVMPEFGSGREEAEEAKAERLSPAVEAALARREPARAAPLGYWIDEAAEVERSKRARRPGVRERAGDLMSEARSALQRQAQDGLARFVRGASDEQLERRFGNQLAQRAIFAGMARQFDPKFAQGFEGDILYELEHHVDGHGPREPERWTIRVKGDHASVVPGPSPDPTVTLHFRIPDFARVITMETQVPELLFSGRFTVEGDFQVASRLSEMFGGPSAY